VRGTNRPAVAAAARVCYHGAMDSFRFTRQAIITTIDRMVG